jgi:hypothetical protein
MTYIMDKVYDNLYAKNENAEGEHEGGTKSVVLNARASNANGKGQSNNMGSDCRCMK